jgi:hypothetical protein
LLGPLQDNGGLTQTMALLFGSPALDAGDSSLLPNDPDTGKPYATDQRGPGFPRVVNGQMDIGAFEVQPLSITTTSLPGGTYGTAYTPTPLTGAEAGFSSFTFSVTSGTLPSGLTLASAGTLSGTPTAVGAFTFTVTATDSTGFSASQSYTLTIDKAALTITANSTSKTYGQSLAFAGTEFTTSGLVNGDTVSTVGLTSSGAAADAGVADSPYAIVPSAAVGSGLDNYTISYVDGSLTVTPAPLTITASNAWKIAGEANPAFTVYYSGFVLGEGTGVLGGTLTFSTPATAGSPPGSYAITPAGLNSANYTITFVPGTLTVLSYGQAIGNLQARVDAAGLAKGMQSSLDSQLQAAIAYFAAGDTADGVSQLGAFIHHVSAQGGKQIATGLANAWVADAQEIINAVP